MTLRLLLLLRLFHLSDYRLMYSNHYYNFYFRTLKMEFQSMGKVPLYRITSHTTAALLIHCYWLMEQPLQGSSINLYTILMCQSSHWVYCQPIQVL